ESVCAAPDADPERARVVSGSGAEDGFSAGGHFVSAGSSEAVGGVTGENSSREIISAGPVLRVQQEIWADLAVVGDDGPHGFRMCGGFLPCGGGGDHGFDVDLVGVEEKTDEGHLVIGLVSHIGNDDGAAVSADVVDVSGRELGAKRGGDGE